MESGDLIIPAAEGALDWSRVHELGEVVAGRRLGRQSASEINLFESNGLAIQDVAAAQVVYAKARAAGIGTELPIG
jgi:alanine dehydrogenase